MKFSFTNRKDIYNVSSVKAALSAVFLFSGIIILTTAQLWSMTLTGAERTSIYRS